MQKAISSIMAQLIPNPGESNDNVVVLLVEDEPTQQEIWHRVIHQAGITVETASTKREALSKLDKADILILDWRLSGTDGQVIFDRWLDAKSGNPCAVVSGHIDPPLRSQLIRDGAYNTLEKPVDLEGLRRVVLRYAAQIRQSKEIAALRQDIFKLKRTTFLLLLVALISLVLSGSDKLLTILGLIT